MSGSDKSVFKRPLSSFSELSKEKLHILIQYIFITKGFEEEGKKIPAAQLVDRVNYNRRYASMVYAAFKDEIEKFISSDYSKPIGITSKKEKISTFSPSNQKIVNFSDFKKKRTS